MQGVFTEIVPHERLVFTDQAFDENGAVLLEGTTSVTFEDLGGKTKITVKTGATGEAPQTAMMLEGMQQGWQEQLEKLGAFAAAH
ncbi:MAG: SRPBCC family protein [Minisyncoccia bacterium]